MRIYQCSRRACAAASLARPVAGHNCGNDVYIACDRLDGKATFIDVLFARIGQVHKHTTRSSVINVYRFVIVRFTLVIH